MPVPRVDLPRVPALLRLAADLVALALADFARVEPDFAEAAFEPLPVERLAVARFVVDRLAVERFAVERAGLARPLEARALLARPLLDPPDDPLSLSSPLQLPLITRCAASATASAINAPSLLALDMTLVAACDALSAASIPASRILRRAAGLALIAAAAAANPAPSISRLIAALVILSTVELLDFFERDEVDFFFVLDFAMAKTSRCNEEKTLQPRNGSVGARMSNLVAFIVGAKMRTSKRGPLSCSDPLRHGQRPEVPAVRECLKHHLANDLDRPLC